MIFLKWYSIVLTLICLLRSLYVSGKEDTNFLIVIVALLIEMPLIIYLILS